MALWRYIRVVFATCLPLMFAASLPAQTAGAGLYPIHPFDSPSLPLEMLDVRCDILGKWAVTHWEMRFRGGEKAHFTFPLAPEDVVTSVEVHLRSQGNPPKKLPGTWERFEHISPAKPLSSPPNATRQVLHQSFLDSYGERLLQAGPLESKGKDVRIVVVTKRRLEVEKDEYVLRLPLGISQAADSFQLRLEAHGQVYKPLVKARELNSLRFKRRGGNYSAMARRLDYEAEDLLTISLPITQGAHQAWFGSGQDSIPFALHLAREHHPPFTKPPRRIALAWDASLVGGQRDLESDFQLLDRIFRPLPEVAVEVLVFDREIRESRTFQLQGGDWGELKDYLKTMAGDGARNYAALAGKFPECDLALLFTAFPEQSSHFPTLPKNAFLIQHNTPSAHRWAQSRGLQASQVINLSTSDLRDAFDQIRLERAEITRLKYKSKHVSAFSAKTGDEAAGGAMVTGVLTAPTSQVSVVFGHGGKPSEKVKFKLDPTEKEEEMDHLLTALASPGMDFPRLFPTSFMDLAVHGRDLPHAWQPWLQALEAWEQQQQMEYATQKAELQAWNRELYAEEWNEMRRVWAGKYDPDAKLPEPTLSYDPARSPSPQNALDSSGSDPVLLQFFQVPPLILAGDSIYSNGLPQALEKRVLGVEWIRGGALTARFGPAARNGILWARLEDGPQQPSSYLSIPEWEDEAPYLKNQFGIPSEDLATYRFQLPRWRSHPSFFLDWADQFIVQGQTDLAIRCLSNFSATEQEEPVVLRAAAHRLMAWGAREIAVDYFQKVAEQLPGDVTALRDLGLALERAGRYEEAKKALEGALGLDGEMLDARFPGIRKVLLRELNHLCVLHSQRPDTNLLPMGFPSPMPLDLRITCDWNRSDTDVDLIVTGPDSVTCDYDQPVTPSGGMIAGDVTDGFGPEEFVQRKAMRGVYKIEVEYEDNPERRVSGPTFVLVTIYTDYGGAGEQIKTIPLRLSGKSGRVEAARVSVE